MDASDLSAAQHMPFIDHQSIAWDQVRRIRCLFYQRFHYEYPGPIHDLKQRLVVIPADQYGSQHLRDHHLTVSPAPSSTHQTIDRFGNRVLELAIPMEQDVIAFEVVLVVERETHPAPPPVMTADQITYWLKPTKLTMTNPYIDHIAHLLQQQSTSPHDLAQRINDWVYANMQYKGGVTTVDTAAAEVMAIGQGLCQDYAHLMICLCRVAGLPARYVSGHLLGEGGSHAWVEVLIPTDAGVEILAFDPTNNYPPHLNYITVAVGRDYRDVSPTSGSFTAPYEGHLTCSKRAGLTHVEYLNGEILTSTVVL